MSGLRWLEGPFGRDAANPWIGQATGGGSVPRSAKSLRSRPAAGGSAHFSLTLTGRGGG